LLKKFSLYFALVLITCHSAWADAAPPKVSIQLLWLHQFEFAGYYAALHKGFYTKAGLDVSLKEGAPSISPINEVLEGRADFGVSSSGLVKSFIEGKPVLMLAPILQHSPEVLLSLRPNLNTPADVAKAGLIGLQPGDESLDLKAMFVNEGIALDKLNINTQAHGLKDLLAGKIIATNGYISNEPFLLQQRKIPYSIIKPSHYGMDFYNNILFTTQALEKSQPKVVAAFRTATLKGWEYALSHQDEIIELILNNYNTQGKSREHLAFEAKTLTSLIDPDLIQIGHSNPWRWHHIVETYAKLGVVQPDQNLDGFFYNPPLPDTSRLYRLLFSTLLVLVVISSIALYIYRINRKLKKSEEGLKLAASVFSHAHEGILITDKNGLIVNVNAMFCNITGYSQTDVIGQNSNILNADDMDEQEHYNTMWDTVTQKGYWYGEVWNKRKNGETFATIQSISALRDSQGNIQHYVSLFSDISERKQMEQQLNQLAFHDTLTGLPNRRLLSDRFKQITSQNKRYDAYGALMFIDLDNFKPLNDRHGHAAGDLLLIEAALRLEGCIREMDTIARFGGDEFVVMLGQLDKDKAIATAQTSIVADKILARLSKPYLLKTIDDGTPNNLIEHHCTASIGVTLFSHHTPNLGDIMKWADIAMYQAKNAGRNQVYFDKTKA
jgi:diguanylate cyclase (GGDEF)-like protein/PAS domain S-box-containing protein